MERKALEEQKTTDFDRADCILLLGLPHYDGDVSCTSQGNCNNCDIYKNLVKKPRQNLSNSNVGLNPTP